jgi:hypothetical protein
MPHAEISVREFITARDLPSRIKQYVATQLDPDYKTYPHLFRDYKSSDMVVVRKPTRCVSQCEVLPSEPKANALQVDLEESRYKPVSGNFKVIPKTVLKLAGWKKITGIVQYAQPQEFIDTETGEILTNRDIFMRAINSGIGYSISERYLDSLITFNRCTSKELPFIRFVLSVRNRRGGLLMGIRDLIDVWLDISGIQVRPGDLARKRRSMINMLKKRKILANESLPRIFRLERRYPEKRLFRRKPKFLAGLRLERNRVAPSKIGIDACSRSHLISRVGLKMSDACGSTRRVSSGVSGPDAGRSNSYSVIFL